MIIILENEHAILPISLFEIDIWFYFLIHVTTRHYWQDNIECKKLLPTESHPHRPRV